MTDENTQTPITKPDETTTPQNHTDNKKDIIEVDLLEGFSVPMTIENAKKYIEIRKNAKKPVEELQNKIKALEQSEKTAREKAEILEKMKNNNFEEAKELISKEYTDKLSKLKEKIIKDNLATHLSSNPNFLNSESNRKDAINLILSENSLEIDDSGEVKSGELDAAKIVEKFLENRDAFKKANVQKTLPQKTLFNKPTIKNNTAPSTSEIRTKMEEALAKKFGKK